MKTRNNFNITGPILALSAALVLTACAAPGKWYRDNTDLSQFEQDYIDCDLQARRDTVNLPMGVVAGSRRGEITRLCMMQKGYRWRED